VTHTKEVDGDDDDDDGPCDGGPRDGQMTTPLLCQTLQLWICSAFIQTVLLFVCMAWQSSA
jgi:hypothetical protein